MEYISIGTNVLMEEYFYQILNSNRRLKPVGGLWCSLYYAPTFNEWIDFIVGKPMYYSKYVHHDNPFKINGVLVDLKEGTKVFNLDSLEALEELEKKYNLDYEKLAQDYDAMYTDTIKLNFLNSPRAEEYARIYAVRSLTAFDLCKIKGYKNALIELEPFDYTFGSDYGEMYDTKVEDEVHEVIPMSKEYIEFLDVLYEKLKDFIFKLRINNPEMSSNKLAYLVKEELMKIIGHDIELYARSKELDEERLAYSLATRTVGKVK